MQLDETSADIVSNYVTLFKTEAVRCNLVSCCLSQESLLHIWRGFWSDGRKMNLMKLEMFTLFWSLNINGYCWEWGVIELKKKGTSDYSDCSCLAFLWLWNATYSSVIVAGTVCK